MELARWWINRNQSAAIYRHVWTAERMGPLEMTAPGHLNGA